MRNCIYCGHDKPVAEFSDEHIWPEALGGDLLPKDVWRTDRVCRSCNSMSGVFVDGAFIRSWMGKAEASQGALAYLAGRGAPVAIPLAYMGPLRDIVVRSGHVAEVWLGPCGDHIIHIRPELDERDWQTYAGGKPHRLKALAGRVYISLTSAEPFWQVVCLLSVRRQFKRASHFVVNAQVPKGWPFAEIDRSDADQAEDLVTVDAFTAAAQAGQKISGRMVLEIDLGARLLAKLALALGFKLLGDEFLGSDYGRLLRVGFRMASFEKRQALAIHGSPYFHEEQTEEVGRILRWDGGWVLGLHFDDQVLSLTVTAPSGRMMSIRICDDPTLLANLDPVHREGSIWLAVPTAEAALGPLPFPAYLSHRLGTCAREDLDALARMRSDQAQLPPCR